MADDRSRRLNARRRQREAVTPGIHEAEHALFVVERLDRNDVVRVRRAEELAARADEAAWSKIFVRWSGP